MFTFIKAIQRSMKGGISYSLLNIFGLTISLVISIYIFIGIQNEMSYDNYSKRERMYRLVSEYPTNTGSNFGVSFPGPLAPTLKAQLHGIENYCRIESLWIYEFIKNEQSGSLLSKSKMRVASVDASFFDFFDIRDIERVFKKIVPDFPFTFRTIKDDFTVDYENTLLSYRIINLFTIISIIISCIGLLGFIGYSLDGRKREIAICKVVGANMISLVWRLQKEYIYLALGSMLIAFPLAYFRIQNILNEYAFHIPITWHLFFLSGVSLLLIVVSTILYKTIKTASINPVEIIKQNN